MGKGIKGEEEEREEGDRLDDWRLEADTIVTQVCAKARKYYFLL